MPKDIQEERYRWIKPIIDRELRIVDVIKLCPHSRRSLKRWLAAYRKGGKAALIPRSTRPKTNPKETSIRAKEEVIGLRKTSKLCAKKLSWRLAKKGFKIHERTIGKILKKEGLTRRYRTKKIIYKYIRTERNPGELIEIDVKYVPETVGNKRYFQYTAIDTASRWRYLAVYSGQNGWNSRLFLQDVIERFPHRIQAVKTDNGAIFTNRYTGTYKRLDRMPKGVHCFDIFCNGQNIIHYLIDPGKPAQNGTVERSHREDQEKFYDGNVFKDFSDLRRKLRRWNIYYNDLEHCGLNGRTPNEILELFEVTNVRT